MRLLILIGGLVIVGLVCLGIYFIATRVSVKPISGERKPKGKISK